MWRRTLRVERLEDRRVLSADFNGDGTVDGFDLDVWKFGFGAVGTATQAQGDANSDAIVDGADFLQMQREFGPTRNNLIVYRPQSVQDPDDPIASPIYAPFRKWPVSETLEVHHTYGPGIRINHDDDDNNGTADALQVIANISLENDLIEVKIERLAGTGDLVLTKGANLRLYYDHKKLAPLVFPGGPNSEVLPFDNNKLTVFVEWISTTHGTDLLNLVEPGTATTHDSIRFHSFRSFTVIFGGRNQDPHDEDGDGSIGDPEPLTDAENRQGIFDMAHTLYDAGWDVMAFNEADYTQFTESVAEREIKNAIDNRFVNSIYGGGVAIWGYSQGGGVVHDLIEDDLDFFNNDQYLPMYVVYLDAVRHDGVFAETDWPGGVFFLLNIYQTLANQTFSGGPLEPLELNDFGEYLEEINVTTDVNFPNTLEHFQIDDDVAVQTRILLRHDQLLDP